MGRLKFLPETNFSSRIYLHLRYKGIKTLWMQRLATLESKFGPNPKLQQTKKESEWRQEVNEWITQISTDIWRKAVTKKRSLSCYATHKLAPGCEPYYRGDKSSALLFQARTGSLATQQRRHELFDSEPSCRLCGAAEETVTHVLQDCPRLHDKPRTSPSLPELLGLSGQTEENHFDRVNYTKDLLLRWDRLNREVATTSARETPRTPSSAAPRTDTPPPCGNGSKQTDEKLAAWQGQSCFKTQVENSG
ncbi:hypothetical protein HPB52_006158 [Rhipicephalus sanguineus]|uniref:Tick transposon n=1 Tax=Rhipicephalus sanguineus TaxID=34632 RepID=A0A9D4QA18_RHISA|nr:hypothetical protein HPB52_006158 [Rhipicephalus sanguineus]